MREIVRERKGALSGTPYLNSLFAKYCSLFGLREFRSSISRPFSESAGWFVAFISSAEGG
jgi:hypothetical protein